MCCSFSVSLLGLNVKSRCVGLARVGSTTQTIAQGNLEDIGNWELGGPLHSLVIIGNSHPLEDRMLELVCNAKLVAS
jgi:diphthine synthase